MPESDKQHTLENRSSLEKEPSEDTLSALVARMPTAVLLTDVEGRIVLTNPRLEEMFGYQQSDLVGRTMEFLLPRRFRESHVHQRHRFYTDAQPRPMGSGLCLMALSKDGQELQVDVQLTPLDSKEGLLIAAFVSDITDQKKAERELIDRARQQAAVAEIGQLALAEMPLGELMDKAMESVACTLGVEYSKVLEVLPDGKFLLRSGVGWKEGLIGKAIVAGGLGSQAGFTLESEQPVIVKDVVTESRFDDVPLLLDHDIVSGLSVAILGGEIPFGVLGAHTSRRRSFTEDDVHFLQSIANLLAASIDRTRSESQREELEEQLRHSQKMQAVGQLAGGVAHDFNNLLTAVLGQCELLLTGLEEMSPMRKAVVEIEKAGLRAAALTRQLLVFSRRQFLKPEVLDLNLIVTDTGRMLEPLLGENIGLEIVLAPSLGRIRADPGQLEQVLLNLALNARDAMPSGGSLTIETSNVQLDEVHSRRHPDLPPGPYVLISVSDTGFGIDEETQTRLFEPFFTTKEPGKGTGLGLATVYGIVKQSGGYIWVYSELGSGTTFKVYFPQTELTMVETKIRIQDSAEQILGGSETILVAEDNDSVRALVCDNLSERGYQVLPSPNGREALEVAQRYSGTIQLLLTDVIMPEMDGHQLARSLVEIRPEIKVLFMSGYSENAIVQTGLLDSSKTLLQKPFTPRALLLRVRRVLDS